MSYDVIVVGAGSSGAMLATRTSQKGLKVALIDRKPQDKIGKKVCGDAVAKFHLKKAKEEVGFEYPTGEELQRRVNGLAIHPPNRKNVLKLHDEEQEGYVLERKLFGQRILNLALDSGAELIDNSFFKKFEIEKGQIKGIKIRNRNEDNLQSLKGKIIVDATGSSGVLRGRLPKRLRGHIEKSIHPLEMGYAYRTIAKLDKNKKLDDTDYVHLYFIQEIAKGGYAWIFPRNNNEANVGLGGPKLFTSGLQKKYRNFEATVPALHHSSIIEDGGGYVPIRRPMNSFVSDNFAVIGDAAFQVNPLHGGGIGAGLEAGIILGDTIVKANEEDDFTEENLWQYNQIYNREIGANHASLDIFKLVATSMSDRVFNVAINRGIITEDDIISAGMEGSMKMSFSDKLLKLIKGIDIFGALLKLRTMSNKMKQVKGLYQRYPDSPDALPQWINEIEVVYKPLKEPFNKHKD